MVDRFRALLEEPLDPRAGRAVLVLASAILLGFAALFVLAAREPDVASPRSETQEPAAVATVPVAPPTGDVESAENRPPLRRQDPQDEKGSRAARRAARALRAHRALQHVPYRSGKLTVVLAGARGHRAVLRVSAPTVRAARQGWRRFLRRYRDSGRSYLPLFRTTESRRPGGARELACLQLGDPPAGRPGGRVWGRAQGRVGSPGRPEFAHGSGDCAPSIFQSSLLHIEVCS
jgi:hypothetical protein